MSETAETTQMHAVPPTGSWLAILEHARELGRDPDLAAVDDDTLVDQVCTQAAEITAATARWLLLVAELVVRGVWAQQGARTPGEWLSWAVSTSPTTAREHVRVGLALREWPQTRERFLAGTLSYSKVRAVTRVGDPRLEALLLSYADGATAAQLDRIVTAVRQTGSGDPAEADAIRGLWFGSVRGGVTEIRLLVPTDEAERVRGRVQRGVEALADAGTPAAIDEQVADEDAPPGPRVAAPIAAQRLDALLHLITAGADHVTEDRTLADDTRLVVHVDAHAHTGEDDVAWHAPTGAPDQTRIAPAGAPELAADAPAGAPGDEEHAPAGASPHDRAVPVLLGSGRTAAMSPRTLRMLACRAAVTAVLSDGNGTPTSVGRLQRYATSAQKLALRRRDATCRFPSCTATLHLHAHHVEEWQDGGATDLDNLVLLCGAHHRFLHHNDWTLRLDAAGHVRVAPPGGDDLPTTLDLVSAPAGASALRVRNAGLEPTVADLRPPNGGHTRDLGDAVALLLEAIDRLAPPDDEQVLAQAA